MLTTFFKNHTSNHLDDNFIEALNIILECSSREEIIKASSYEGNLLIFFVSQLQSNIKNLINLTDKKANLEEIEDLKLKINIVLDFIKRFSWPELLEDKRKYFLSKGNLNLTPKEAIFHIYTLIDNEDYQSPKHLEIIKEFFPSSIMDILNSSEASKVGPVGNKKLNELIESISSSKSYNDYINFLNTKTVSLSQMDFFITNKLIEMGQINKLTDKVLLDFSFNFPDSIEKISEETYQDLYKRIKKQPQTDFNLDFSYVIFDNPRMSELASLVKTKNMNQIFNIISHCLEQKDFSYMKKYARMDSELFSQLMCQTKEHNNKIIQYAINKIIEASLEIFNPTKQDLAGALSQSIEVLPVIKKYYEKIKLEEIITDNSVSAPKFKL